jgi:hypothetical protein
VIHTPICGQEHLDFSPEVLQTSPGLVLVRLRNGDLWLWVPHLLQHPGVRTVSAAQRTRLVGESLHHPTYMNGCSPLLSLERLHLHQALKNRPPSSASRILRGSLRCQRTLSQGLGSFLLLSLPGPWFCGALTLGCPAASTAAQGLAHL